MSRLSVEASRCRPMSIMSLPTSTKHPKRGPYDTHKLVSHIYRPLMAFFRLLSTPDLDEACYANSTYDND
jgi:hypothetical protein